MSDVLVILGTVAIVGVVAIATVAIVYDRFLWFRATNASVELRTDPLDGTADGSKSDSHIVSDR
jgi:hypothetical protein